jgi:hypothetical protein
VNAQAGDYSKFWLKPELLHVQASETCAHALDKMARADAQSVLVVEATDSAQPEASHLLGLVSTDKLLLYVPLQELRLAQPVRLSSMSRYRRYFLHCLVPNFQAPTAKPYEHTRARAEEAIRQFGAVPLRDVVRFYFAERAPLLGAIRDDEAFFSILLRFASGESSVAVAPNYSSNPHSVLGCLTTFDMLAWLDEDLTMLSKVACGRIN